MRCPGCGQIQGNRNIRKPSRPKDSLISSPSSAEMLSKFFPIELFTWLFAEYDFTMNRFPQHCVRDIFPPFSYSNAVELVLFGDLDDSFVREDRVIPTPTTIEPRDHGELESLVFERRVIKWSSYPHKRPNPGQYANGWALWYCTFEDLKNTTQGLKSVDSRNVETFKGDLYYLNIGDFASCGKFFGRSSINQPSRFPNDLVVGVLVVLLPQEAILHIDWNPRRFLYQQVD